MRETTKLKGGSVIFVLANDTTAMDLAQKAMESFGNGRSNQSFIFIAYHVREDVILLHIKNIKKGTDFDSAIRMVKKDIQEEDLCADDTNLKKVLGDPQATTAKFLLDYIESEEY